MPRVEDQIDPAVGFIAEVKIGDEVKGGRLIGTVFCGDAERGRCAAARIQAAYEIGDEPVLQLPELIKEVIE